MNGSAYLLAAAAALLLILAPAAPAEDALALRKVSIDATVTVGTLRPLSGINSLPDSLESTAFYRLAHIDLVAVPNVFAATSAADSIFPDWNADASDPKSYHFAPTDKRVTSIRSAGAQPLLRVGRPPGAAEGWAQDLAKHAEIVRHLVLHYNKGWAKGFDHSVRYWEIDTELDPKNTAATAPEQYYAMYDELSRAITLADDAAQVGGPGLAQPLNAGPYREGLVDYARYHRLALNFFAWHFYSLDSSDPYNFVDIARELRIVLDRHGFGSTRSVLDRWNVDFLERELSQAARSAFAASALIYMTGGPVDAQSFDGGSSTLRSASGPDEVAHALAAFGSLQNTPLLVRVSGGDEVGFAVIAGRSLDRRVIQVLISNFQIEPKSRFVDLGDELVPPRRLPEYHDNEGYDALINLAVPGRYQVKRYRISDSANFTLVDQSVQSGASIHLQAQLPPPAVEFIVVTAL